MKSATIIEVAREAGISKTAVSDILRGEGERFRPETIQRVRDVAQELGYHANGAARLLAQRRKTLVGLSMIFEQRPHFNYLVRAAHREIEKRGYHPLPLEPYQLASTPEGAPFPDPKMLAGLISADLLLEGKTPDFYRALQRHLPVVALYPALAKNVDVVATDHAQIIEMAAAHLAQQGHHRIAFAGDSAPVPSEKEKWVGWKRAVKKWRLDPDPACEIPLSPLSKMPSYEASVEMVRHLMAMQPRPTALICTNEIPTISCLARLAEAGCHVPRDLSVVSYGVDDHGTLASPPLTIVLQPTERIAQLAVERLFELMKPPAATSNGKNGNDRIHRARQILLAPSLLERGSTAAPRK